MLIIKFVALLCPKKGWKNYPTRIAKLLVTLTANDVKKSSFCET
jgi:hypothetical protein